MRILWFTNTPSCYNTNNSGYNGGGWISSLEKEIKNNNNIELAICFHYPQKADILKKDNITYYPIKETTNLFYKIFGTFNYIANKCDKQDINQYLNVISDFKPDIINIFGSEKNFGLISLHTNIPIVLHIQGLLTPYSTAFYPPGFSFFNTLSRIINPLEIYKKYRLRCKWKHNVKREQIILKNIKYFLGRTKWDKRITNIYAPQGTYFHCDEILRDIFYKFKNKYSTRDHLTITTTISTPYYKGFDTILRAAYILKYNLNLDFTWNVFGIKDISIYEKRTGICANKCNIKVNGIADAKTLCEIIATSSIFVHPSYIDNSPNSICEAQILGCPTIATNVGGIPSLIKHNETGLLIPANDPYQMAYLIKRVFLDKELAIKISTNGQILAKERHNKDRIVNTLIDIYNKITQK